MRSERAARWSLVVASLGSSMAFIDSTVVNVALPVMQRDLDVEVDLVQWIIEAYALFLASLVLVGGALGDKFGRRRVFVTGVVIFAAASIGCGIAPSAMTLIVARSLQGFGAALLVPGSLALISAAYPDRDARGVAIGTWSAVSAVTTAIGPVAGGWVVTHASWRWLFLFNVPIAIAVVALAQLRVAETRDEATMGLGLVVYALIDSGSGGGLGNPRILSLLIGGSLTLVLFVVVEARSRSPMMPLSVFRSRTFSGANLLTLLLYAALGGGLFFLPFNLIQVQRYSPAAAGAALLPFVVLISVMSRWAGGFAGRVGARVPLVLGPVVAAGGFALLAILGTGENYVRSFLPGIIMMGVGMGITVAPLTTAVMGSVNPDHAGVASGINNAVARAAGLLAIAALGVVLRARFDAVLDRVLSVLSLSRPTAAIVDAERGKLGGADFGAINAPFREAVRDAFGRAYVAGFRAVMITCAALAVLGALGALLLVEAPPKANRRQPAGGAAPSPTTNG